MQIYNYISVLRVLSMLAICWAHCNWLNTSATSQLLVQGVQVFLLISGILYGKKIIMNKKDWIIERWKKICIPMYLFLIPLSLILYTTEITTISIYQILIYLFDLQGLNFIISTNYFRLSELPATGPLWFITIIMLCYIIVAILPSETNIYSKNITSKRVIKWIFAFFILQVLSSTYEITLNLFFIYFIGYYFSPYFLNTQAPSSRFTFFAVIIMLFAMFGRVLGRMYFDGTTLYETWIVALTVNTFAICSVFIMKKICFINYNFFARLVESKFWEWLDSCALYIFIVHYASIFFLERSIKAENNSLKTISFIFLTIIAAIILKKLHFFVLRLCFRQK